MIYAHAQKNLGPSGVTVAVIRRSLLDRIPHGLPAILDLRTHVTHGSNYNTPPVFAIYVLTLVTRWMRNDVGGVQAINRRKAQRLYATLGELGDAVRIHADPQWRSQMNVAFTFGDERLDSTFMAEARELGITGLEGHRSIGGMRASLYNAVTEEAVETLCGALMEFCQERV
jgi:phosphoserine aminotransferase